jgi:exodeoxyribonuclease V beta subunit
VSGVSGGDAPLYPFPEELLRVPRDASAVIEASAGTGKTYLLEHLVVDRIVRGDARLEEILVVTFTDKATAELTRRVRDKIVELLAYDGAASGATLADVDRAWRLDSEARARLREALHGFDRATITTIHGFCQRVLTEDAFGSRRLLQQRHVDSGKAFADAFTETLRTTLATDPRLEPYLRAWLGTGRGITRLERTLYAARVQRRPFGLPYDEARLLGAIEAFAAITIDPRLFKDLVKRHSDGTIANATAGRNDRLGEMCRRHLERREPAMFLRELDDVVDAKDDFFSYVERRWRTPVPAGPLADFHAAFLAVADAAPPLVMACASLFLPLVEARLEARKRAGGFYDFDDMVALAAAALRGPGGPALVASLRRRYRLAIIDEFQDTDAAQWEIFRALFQQSGGENPLYVVADPKQSIYGFRGADVLTYQAARREVTGGDAPTLTLGRNFRSTPAIVGAYNAILDPTADEPFFADRTLYPEPVAAAREPESGAGAPAVLLAVRPAGGAEIAKLPLRQVRQALTRAIADEIAALAAGPSPPPLREIFVLTRLRAEARQVASALRDAGIPHALYNQEGLYETDEARELRDLLAAVDDPRDVARRFRAWLTPFFGLRLADLPACAGLPAGHPLEERLAAWHALAEARDWPRLFDRILDESGVARRELLSGSGLRRLTNYQHLCELLLAEGTRSSASLGDLVRRLTALTERAIVPAPEEGNVQRLEGDRDAVQIMTMHKAKGLEADAVFFYGAYTPFRGQGVKAYDGGGARVLHAGRARRRGVEEAIKSEEGAEDQRLLYVALTRARRRLYLPYAGTAELERDPGREETYWRVGGAYRHVHQRVRALVDGRDARFPFEARAVTCPPPPDGRAARLAPLADFRPAPGALAWSFPAEALAERKRRHAGVVLTSYTRLKEARRGFEPPTEISDEVPSPLAVAPEGAGDAGAAGAEAAAPGLPGGAPWGIFLHAVLEAVPLEGLAGGPPLAAWAARADVQALFETAMRRHDRDAQHRAEAERLVHAALTTPIPVAGASAGGATLPGIAAADRVAREVEFLFPFPDAAGGAERGFIKGYIDVVFEHAGRTYFADWKSDLLPSYTPEAVAAHVEASYELQRRLYALALVKMLGIADRDDYEARFGGTAYVFLRALPDGGLSLARPSWDELRRFEGELAAELGP